MSVSLLMLAAVTASISLLLCARLAGPAGLMDVPNSRKAHVGHIPVVGGLAMVLSMPLMLWLGDIAWPFNPVIALLALVLFVSGLVDDKIGLAPGLRFCIQLAVALLTVFVGDLHLYFFGDIFGYGDFYLGIWGELLAVLAIITAVNAFNMIDGIDGLLGMLLLVAIGGLWYTDASMDGFYLLCCVWLGVFLLFNLGLLSDKRKVFMGDAGSMLFGYLVVCLLIDKSQHPNVEIRPVTVLYLLAVPLMDLVAIVIRRNRKKQPIMKADRDHLHHIFMRMGMSDRRALAFIILVAVFMATAGLAGEIYKVDEALMFSWFLTLFAFYLYFILHAWAHDQTVQLVQT